MSCYSSALLRHPHFGSIVGHGDGTYRDLRKTCSERVPGRWDTPFITITGGVCSFDSVSL